MHSEIHYYGELIFKASPQNQAWVCMGILICLRKEFNHAFTTSKSRNVSVFYLAYRTRRGEANLDGVSMWIHN